MSDGVRVVYMKCQVDVGYVTGGGLKMAARSEEPPQDVRAKAKLVVGLPTTEPEQGATR